MAVDDGIYDLTPLSHLREGMTVLVRVGDDLVPSLVESVEVEQYRGEVFDLEVADTHSYVANDLLVHNSIYKFRGADLRNILQFEEAFPDVTTVVLDQNYRSTQTILDAANAVIDNNAGRKPKVLWSDNGKGDRITRYQAEDEADEATWVARTAADLHNSDGERWSDIAVFYRTNAQSRIIEEAFMRAGIPYKVIGGTRFYDRKEIKDALAYLRAVINPLDEVSIKRILNEPKRGIGDTTVGRLDAWAAANGQPFIEALRHAEDAGVSGTAVRGIERFMELLDGLAPTRRRWTGRAAAGGDRSQRVPGRARGGTHDRSSGAVGEPRRADRVCSRVRHHRRVRRAGVAGRRHRPDRRRQLAGAADDTALRQGPRVPERLHRRRRGRCLSAHSRPHRAR